MSMPKFLKFVKRAVIVLGSVTVLLGGVLYIGVPYILQEAGVTYESMGYDFPLTITIENLRYEDEDVRITAKQVFTEWKWKKLFHGKVSGKTLVVEHLYITLKPTEPDTMPFKVTDVIPLQFDYVLGTDIRYYDIGTPDSIVARIGYVYANDFSWNTEVLADTLICNKSDLKIAYMDSTQTDTTGSVSLSNLPKINANHLEINQTNIAFLVPGQENIFSDIALAVNGFGSENPIDFEIAKLHFIYQDTLQVEVRGKEVYIKPDGNMILENIHIKTAMFGLNVKELKVTKSGGVQVLLNKSRVNSSLVKIFYEDIPMVNKTQMMFAGKLNFTGHGVSFSEFDFWMGKHTSATVSGMVNMAESPEMIDVKITHLRTTLFELQEIFETGRIEGQENVTIDAMAQIHGATDKLSVYAQADLNQIPVSVRGGYNLTRFGEHALFIDVQLADVEPYRIITAIPKKLNLKNMRMYTTAVLDTSLALVEPISTFFQCGAFTYDAYSFNRIVAETEITSEHTTLKMRAPEQNFTLNWHTDNDIMHDSSIAFRGNIALNIPTLTDLSQKAGFMSAPFSGYFQSTCDILDMRLCFDTLLFQSDKLENDIVKLLDFRYTEFIDEEVEVLILSNSEEVLSYNGSPELLEWFYAEEIDTADYPCFTGNIRLEVDSAVFEVIAGCQGSIHIDSLHIETSKHSIAVSMEAPLLEYEAYRITGTRIDYSTNFSSYQGILHIDSLKNPYAGLNSVNLEIQPSDKKKIYTRWHAEVTGLNKSVDFGITLLSHDSGYAVKFTDHKPVTIAAQTWEVIENKGVLVDRNWKNPNGKFTLSNDSQQVIVLVKNDEIDFYISHLNVGPFYTIFTSNSSLYAIANMHAKYQIENGSLRWKGSSQGILLDSMQVGEFVTIGEYANNKLTTHNTLSHGKSLLVLDAEIENSFFRFDVDLKSFDLGSINPIISHAGIPASVEGMLFGHIKGEYNESLVMHSGKLGFSQVVLKSEKYGVFAKIPKEEIEVSTEFARFDNFAVYDNRQNKILVNGAFSFTNSSPMNLQLTGGDFRVLDQPDKRQQVWGKADIKTDIRISGTYDKLAVSGFLTTLKSSKIGYRYESTVTLTDLEEEIIFTSFSDTAQKNHTSKELPAWHRDIRWNVDVNIEQTELYILLYAATNDYIRMTTNGVLRLRSGSTLEPVVFGKIQSTEGSIFYDAPMVSDLNLKIEEASISFFGESGPPRVSFRGVETFRINSKEISGQTAKGEIVPVDVIAILEESPITNFVLRFDLHSENGEVGGLIESLPADTRETYALNLLVFGSIEGGGEGSSTALMKAVAKLNELSRRNLNSTELTFFVDSEDQVQATNGQTINTIGYNFSRGFFHKKIRVSIGGDVTLNQNMQDGRRTINPIGNVEIEYIIKEHNPYIAIGARRKDSYRGAIEGQVDEYSVGLKFSKWFRNLFSTRKKKE